LAQGRIAESNTVQTECQEKQIGKIGYNSLWANTMNDIIWMYTHGGEVRGPVSFAYLKSLADMGQIHSDSRVWKVGDNRWVLTNEFISPRQRQPLGPVIPDKSLPFLIEGVPCSERRVPGLDSNAKVILLVGLMIALVAAIIVLNIILPSKEPGLDEAGASLKLDKEYEIKAMVNIKDRIKAQHRSPSTVEFPWFDYTVKFVSRNRWKITSYFDGQNLFGATVRTDYEAIVDEGGNIESLILKERL